MDQQAMVEVSKERFYALVGPRNVHPRAERSQSVWIDQSTHGVVGISTPGFLCEGPESYRVRAALSKSST